MPVATAFDQAQADAVAIDNAHRLSVWLDTAGHAYDTTDLAAATNDWRGKVTPLDLVDELLDAEGPFQAALDTGNPTLVGEVVLAVLNGYARRIAVRELYGSCAHEPDATECAARAIVANLSKVNQ